MKESKFIELLNLYIDAQISPEEATLLEAEILQNPRRRQIYSQYCRIHRACTIALEQHPAGSEAKPEPGKVVAFKEPRRARWGYYAAGMAAAACVTLLAVHSVVRQGVGASTPAAAAVQKAPAFAKTTPAPTSALAPVHAVLAVVPVLPRTDGFLSQRLRFIGTTGGPFFAASGADKSPFYAPMLPAPTLRATPRQSIEDFVFSRDPAAPENLKIFRSHEGAGDEPEESAAFEFQR
jgi:hypothetical protein